ncbi:peptide ABC transporter substrate-binding protein [Alkaliphilus peptidifermentans]|uniref:Peptide/nickel transport system substrate-binding protein n=1 Tax=Alkaliphilus peptidifermentans DSM 18978 TaxID=1120976 RepID=A0A1G5CVW1_9FIRM|nr:peptide ABC transporter substrate-binding protein [Alkaliphilus peptidifermentans]SCY06340.1 peptide/nickel transport system substrate-binding protein [Alkaliphilus peptidifermentans DSM 18978]
MKHKKIFLLLVLIMTMLIAACSQEIVVEEPNNSVEIIENLEPIKGGTLNLSVTRFNTFNPLFNNNKGIKQLQNIIFEGLISFNKELELQPALAEKWEIAEDGQSIEFTLRNGVKWHDGQPFTAEDVLFTFQVIKGNITSVKNTSVYRMSLQQISDMRIIDENRIRVTFTRPFSNGLEVMTFPILPKHLFDGNKASNLDSESFPIIGTGPYQLEEHQPMRDMKLKRNDAYWGESPYIDNIAVNIVPDREAQLSQFENGDIDFAEPISIDWGKYSDSKNVNVYEYVSNYYEFVGFNSRNKLVNDPTIRKAIAYGIDRHKLINNIYLGHGTVVDVPVFPQSWLYNEESLQYGYDANKATALLEEAGYVHSEDKVRSNEAGEELKLILVTNNDNLLREKTAYFIKDELEAIGIEVEVKLLDWEELNEQLNTNSYDMLLGGWELSIGQDLSFAFHSAHLQDTNFIAYNNEEMDNLLVEAFRSANREEKKNNYDALQMHISNELPYFSLFFQNRAILVRDKVKGDLQPQIDNSFNGIEGWFIEAR